MKKACFILVILLVCGASLAAWFVYLRSSMDSPEVIRKLSGLRLSVTLYKNEKNHLPVKLEEVALNGNLEELPKLKLSYHMPRSKVRNTDAYGIKDTGGWAYVNNPESPDYGLVFIDSSRQDEKQRYWSWF